MASAKCFESELKGLGKRLVVKDIGGIQKCRSVGELRRILGMRVRGLARSMCRDVQGPWRPHETMEFFFGCAWGTMELFRNFLNELGGRDIPLFCWRYGAKGRK